MTYELNGPHRYDDEEGYKAWRSQLPLRITRNARYVPPVPFDSIYTSDAVVIDTPTIITDKHDAERIRLTSADINALISGKVIHIHMGQDNDYMSNFYIFLDRGAQ